MPRDLDAALCMNCPYRPIDPETNQPVEGGVRVAVRAIEFGQAVVLYSQEDPRINNQYGLTWGADPAEIVRHARTCAPSGEGLEVGTGNFDKRIEQAARDRAKRASACALGKVLWINEQLPENLLYQVS